MPRNHAAFAGLVDENCHATCEVSICFDEVMRNFFVIQIFARQLTEAISANLANETSF